MKKQLLVMTVFAALSAFSGLSAVSMKDDVNGKIEQWKQYKEDRQKFLEHHHIAVPQPLLEAEERQKINEINGKQQPVKTQIDQEEIDIDEEVNEMNDNNHNSMY